MRTPMVANAEMAESQKEGVDIWLPLAVDWRLR
jgi:hypothetical protein